MLTNKENFVGLTPKHNVNPKAHQKKEIKIERITLFQNYVLSTFLIFFLISIRKLNQGKGDQNKF